MKQRFDDHMAGLLIIAHSPLASALLRVGEHVYAGARVAALDVDPQADPAEVERQARELLDAVRDPEALILTDVFGATPSNVAARLASGPMVRVVAGVNVPMVWRALCYRAEPVDALVGRATTGATLGIMPVGTAPPQNQSSRPNPNDQGDARDQ